MTLTIRLLPFQSADGPHQMAADEAMLESARQGVASIRVYTWSVPTLSLGYFQHSADRLGESRFAHLPWVRRATGGGAIIHNGDLTYALALPKNVAKQHNPADWHCRIHRAIAQFLRDRQMLAQVVEGAARPDPAQREFDCFAIPQSGDVVASGRKIIGGAQRLRAGALLQHGSIQIAEIHSFRGELPHALAESCGWQVVSEEWTQNERNSIEHLAVYKYNLDSWNGKR